MNILREARKFPSVKRDGIVNEIREGTSLCSLVQTTIFVTVRRTIQDFVRIEIWRTPMRFNCRSM